MKRVPELPEALQTASAERDRFIEEMIPYVKFIAYRVAGRLPPSVDLNDLVNYGVIGLLDACKKFDPERGLKFKTYAERRIRGAILDGMRSADWVPRSVRKKRRQLEAAYRQVEQELGRSATDEEIAAHMCITTTELGLILHDVQGVSLGSLEEFAEYGDVETFLHPGFTKPMEDSDPHALIERDELRQIIAGAVAELPEKERLICSLYYYEELTMKEIGQVIGISESRVSQLHTKTMLRIRPRIESVLAGESSKILAPVESLLIPPTPHSVAVQKESQDMQDSPSLELLGISEGTARILAGNHIRTTDDLSETSVDAFLRIDLQGRAKKAIVTAMVNHNLWFAEGEKVTRMLLEKGGCARPKEKSASERLPAKSVTLEAHTNGHSPLAQVVGRIVRSLSDQIAGEGVDVSAVTVGLTLTIGGKRFRTTTTIEPVEQ